MKTDPTAGIAGIAGTPLSHQAIESGNRTAAQASLKSKRSTAISDTVETSDREADGSEIFQQTTDGSNQDNETTSGDLLDLTG